MLLKVYPVLYIIPWEGWIGSPVLFTLPGESINTRLDTLDKRQESNVMKTVITNSVYYSNLNQENYIEKLNYL